MRHCLPRPRPGNAMILTVFVIALAAAMVMGMLQLNTEQTLQLKNQVGLTRATATAEAGLHDALAQLRSNIDWSAGFRNKRFSDGRYTVSVRGTAPERIVTAIGRTSQNYTTRLEARIRTEDLSPPHRIVIEQIRMNP